ncbi:LysM peptidoglycan-binding domain-containing protein [Pontibacter qinzhouensis]|uniref:LysM peptidoglycan-binding domain-containing protein n=1 Tax=Pontibacter qinzhouensis TaxID=2603253 RepID=A0A5C8K242_9BACT|nr:LysM peptidoglycan-binding domain-containing protein [Pontibacter qinzhouensis]
MRDSVGVEYKNGKLFVQHRVEPKETLYALSRKYAVSVSQIVEANPSVESTIKIGQIVLIPRNRAGATAATPARAVPASASAANTAATPAASASNRTFVVTDRGDKIHVVEPGQTLYAISKMHNVRIEDVRAWNNLSGNQVNIGAKLIVGKNAPVTSSKPQYVPESDDVMTKDSVTEAAVATTGPAATVPATTTPAPAATPETTTETTTARNDPEENMAGVKKVLETGMAEMIDPKTDTNKYLALHKSAPVGTIMQVKNAMNDQVVYVRVIGKLPDTGSNDKVIVRLSKKAYQKLGAVDQRFRVELSYVP